MSDVAIRFDHVWKKFRRGELHDSLRDLIPTLVRAAVSRKGREELRKQEFWALEDIDFELKHGEALGIIGPNGSGKSTILKLLSRILKPTRGLVQVNGRLSALIEVGAGFHPDLTGRENIYLNGAILGMTRQEVARAFDEIVDFSGLEAFLDTPVKRYSSGMYARLGFSVAVHVNPEVLLIDEVLSVGDMAFQQKCLERMRAFRESGRTIVFVSHHLDSVHSLCPKAALMVKGRLRRFGSTPEVIEEYLKTGLGAENRDGAEAGIWDLTLADVKSKGNRIAPGERVYLRFKLRCDQPLDECVLGFEIDRLSDAWRVAGYELELGALDGRRGGTGVYDCAVAFTANLLRGIYGISLYVLHQPTATTLWRVRYGVVFSVDEMRSVRGCVELEPLLTSQQTV